MEVIIMFTVVFTSVDVFYIEEDDAVVEELR